MPASRTDPAMLAVSRRYEIPTWIVVFMLYVSWAALVWFHAALPWWVFAPVGAYLVAWHFSLQHEAIHSFRSVPDWLRWTIVMPPLGLWLPFPLYYKSHRQHHQNTHLTEPGVDTESVYVRKAEWATMNPVKRAILIGNQTLVGRVLIGPVLRLVRLVIREVSRVGAGDFSNLPHWIVHAVLVGLLFVYISGIAGMPWWQYILLIAWPAFGLGWVRSFIEHRYGERPGQRTAITESNAFWSVLFLNNNLHAVHHLYPKMPWFDIPAFWRANREKVLAHNGNYHFLGYGEIVRRWLLRPVFAPVHPKL